MTTLEQQEISKNKKRVARKLAMKHFAAEPGLQKVVLLTGVGDVEDLAGEPIKLLEVNSNTIASGILPVNFGPASASGIPYSSVIVEVSPEEFVKIQSQEWKLPQGWEFGEEFSRQSDATEDE